MIPRLSRFCMIAGTRALTQVCHTSAEPADDSAFCPQNSRSLHVLQSRPLSANVRTFTVSFGDWLASGATLSVILCSLSFIPVSIHRHMRMDELLGRLMN